MSGEACPDVVAFANGEPEDEKFRDAVRRHIDACESCRVALVDTMQIAAQLSDSEPPPRPPWLAHVVGLEIARKWSTSKYRWQCSCGDGNTK